MIRHISCARPEVANDPRIDGVIGEGSHLSSGYCDSRTFLVASTKLRSAPSTCHVSTWHAIPCEEENVNNDAPTLSAVDRRHILTKQFRSDLSCLVQDCGHPSISFRKGEMDRQLCGRFSEYPVDDDFVRYHNMARCEVSVDCGVSEGLTISPVARCVS